MEVMSVLAPQAVLVIHNGNASVEPWLLALTKLVVLTHNVVLGKREKHSVIVLVIILMEIPT